MKLTCLSKQIPVKTAHAAAFALLTASAFFALNGCKGRDDNKSAAVQTLAPQKPAARPAGDPLAGKDVYERYCHFCHGKKGLGDGPVGLAITPHPADFVNDTKRMSRTDEELLKSINEGIQREIGGEEMAMPRWKDILTEKERLDVLAYVRVLEREGKKTLKK